VALAFNSLLRPQTDGTLEKGCLFLFSHWGVITGRSAAFRALRVTKCLYRFQLGYVQLTRISPEEEVEGDATGRARLPSSLR